MGRSTPPYLFGALPLPAALYGVLVFPFVWGLTEQMTYNGYLLLRFQVLCRSTSLAIVFVAFAWSLQHAFMPLTFDPKFMAFRLLSSVPNTVLFTASVSATSPVGSARDCARPDGWCECAHRCASSVDEGIVRENSIHRSISIDGADRSYQRSSRGSRARYTSPIPPAPRAETISNGPRRVPAVRAKSGQLYGRDAASLCRAPSEPANVVGPAETRGRKGYREGRGRQTASGFHVGRSGCWATR